MAFIKRDVKDRVVQYPRRYQLVEVQPGIFDLIPVTGTVTEEGTPINKAYLQPIEDGLADALEKTGDGKDVIVTFTEAATEAHIASGEKLSTLFGKILKKFKNVAPKSHASSANTYGVGTTTNFGHCKTINNLTQASHVNGNALSAYQGYLLKGAVHYGKISQMSGSAELPYGSSSSFLVYSTEDIDDFSAINLTSNNRRITIPSGVSKVRFYWKGVLMTMGSQRTEVSLYKNGVKIERLCYVRRVETNTGLRGEYELFGYSSRINVVAGDYFETYADFSSNNGGVSEGAIFGMEVLE